MTRNADQTVGACQTNMHRSSTSIVGASPPGRTEHKQNALWMSAFAIKAPGPSLLMMAIALSTTEGNERVYSSGEI